MRRRSALLLVALVAGSASLLVEACATSGSTEGPGAQQTGDDAGGSTIDSGPILGNDSGGPSDSGGPVVDSGACKLTPPDDNCGVSPQCGCNGTTCDFQGVSGSTIACDTDAGSGEGGAPCVSSADCAPGLTCLFARCHSFCDDAGEPCPAPYSECHQHAAVPHWLVCGMRCDLSNPASCGGGSEGCVNVQATSTTETTECEPVGVGGNGATCASVLDCMPGYSCVNMSTMVCRQLCKYPSGSTCTTGSCNAFGPALIVDGQEYGFCN